MKSLMFFIVTAVFVPAYSQSSFISKEDECKILSEIKQSRSYLDSEYESEDIGWLYYPDMYDSLDCKNIRLVFTYSYRPVYHFKNFDYDKNIFDYIVCRDNSSPKNRIIYNIFLFKEDKDGEYVPFGSLSQYEESGNYSPLYPFDYDRGDLEVFRKVLELSKIHSDVLLFNIFILREDFVKVGNEVFVILDNDLYPANDYLKARYTIEELRMIYQR